MSGHAAIYTQLDGHKKDKVCNDIIISIVYLNQNGNTNVSDMSLGLKTIGRIHECIASPPARPELQVGIVG